MAGDIEKSAEYLVRPVLVIGSSNFASTEDTGRGLQKPKATTEKMPRTLSHALCEIIKSELQAGVDLQTLKSRHIISDKKARTMKKLFDETGEVVNTERKKGSGRPKKLKDEHVQRLRGFLNEHPEAFLKDMCLFMEIEFGLELTESTMQRCCKRIGWSLKKQPRPRDELGFWVRTLPRDDTGRAVRGVRPKKRRSESNVNKLGYTAKRTLFQKTRKFVEDYMSQPHFDTSHGWNHVQRVVALSLEILRVEQNTFRKIIFDSTVLELVALMHDIDDHKYRVLNSEADGYPSPPSNMDPQSQPMSFDIGPSSPMQDQNAAAAPNIDPNLQDATLPPKQSPVECHLLQLGWPEFIASRVAYLTPFVSYTAETTNKPGFAAALAQSPELAVVMDADRLDAIGAIGIGRAFTYGGAKGREGGMAETMNHFEEKLSKLESLMKTGEGKRLSVARAERLRIFGRWWQEEMRLVGMLGADSMEWTKTVSPWVSQEPPPDPNAAGPSGQPDAQQQQQQQQQRNPQPPSPLRRLPVPNRPPTQAPEAQMVQDLPAPNQQGQGVMGQMNGVHGPGIQNAGPVQQGGGGQGRDAGIQLMEAMRNSAQTMEE